MLKKEKPKKISLSFKENERELKLYDWLMKKSEVLGSSGVIKEILLKVMESEE